MFTFAPLRWRTGIVVTPVLSAVAKRRALVLPERSRALTVQRSPQVELVGVFPTSPGV